MFIYWIDRHNSENVSDTKVRLAGGSEPYFSDFPFLKTINWGGMICLQEKNNSKELAELLGIPYLHCPIQDYSSPNKIIIEEILGFYHDCQKKNPLHPLLIHCTAGHGRTGTILASLIVILDHTNPKDAIDKIRKINPLAIETKEQEEFILNLKPL